MKLHAAVKITHPFQVFLDEAMKGDLVHDFSVLHVKLRNAPTGKAVVWLNNEQTPVYRVSRAHSSWPFSVKSVGLFGLFPCFSSTSGIPIPTGDISK